MSADEFFAGLVLEDRLPLRWEILPAAPDSLDLIRWNIDNEAILRALSVLEEHAGEMVEEGHNAQEFIRLEHKLNLLLDMVNQLVVQQSALPAAVSCRFDTQGIEWVDEQCPPVGAVLKLSLYLGQRYPRPLQFLCHVVPPAVDVPAGSCRARIDGLSPALADRLEGHVFRHHRRRVAHARAAQKSAK